MQPMKFWINHYILRHVPLHKASQTKAAVKFFYVPLMCEEENLITSPWFEPSQILQSIAFKKINRWPKERWGQTLKSMHRDMSMKQSESLDFLCTLPALKKTNVCFLLSSSNSISQRDKERKYKDTLRPITCLQKHKHTQQPEPTTQNCFYFTSPFNKKKFHKFEKKKKNAGIFRI